MPERQVITSLTGTVAPLLSVDASDNEELNMASFYLPRNWKKCAPYVDDDVIVSPTGQSGLNQELAFEIPKFATLVGDIVLGIDLPVVNVTPAGNPAFFVDFLGYAIIDYFRTVFGSNLVYEHRGIDLFIDYTKMYNVEKLNAVDQMIFGNTTTAQRSALLLNGTTPGQPVLVPLNQPFAQDPMSALPVVVLSQKTRFLLRTLPLNSITQTPVAGTTLAFPAGQNVNFNLHVYVIHTTGPEANMLLELSRDQDGISYMVHQHTRMDSDTFASVQTGTTIISKLSGITKPLKDLTWGLIPTKMINNTGRNDFFFFFANPPAPAPAAQTPYNPIVRWGIEANGLTIQRTVDRNFTRLYKYMFYYEGFAGMDLYFQSYSRFPQATNSSSGYLDYTNLNNPVLRVIMGVGGTGTDPDVPANPQQLTMIVNARDYNFWFLKSGSLFSLFILFYFRIGFLFPFLGNWSRTFN